MRIGFLVVIVVVFVFKSEAQSSLFTPTINYATLEYFVVGRDTNTITCSKGNYGESNFERYDTINIFANIIYPNLPMVFSFDSLSIRTKEVMEIENIQISYIWRDTKSLWMLPFGYRSEEMIKQENKSSIGWMEITDEFIRYNPKY
jgi:hypothetical protein